MLTEELLRDMPLQDGVQSMDPLQAHLDHLFGLRRTSKLWIDNIIPPRLPIMKFVRAERESDFPLHLKVVKETLPYFFSAGHINYALYGVYYLRQIEHFLDAFQKRFE